MSLHSACKKSIPSHSLHSDSFLQALYPTEISSIIIRLRPYGHVRWEGKREDIIFEEVKERAYVPPQTVSIKEE